MASELSKINKNMFGRKSNKVDCDIKQILRTSLATLIGMKLVIREIITKFNESKIRIDQIGNYYPNYYS
mgnify:CR=1 FL=1